MNFHKIFIAFRLLFLLLFFRWKLTFHDFKVCLDLCDKIGFLKTKTDHEFADKVLRKTLSLIPFQQGCLLHSLALARASQKNLELYLSFLQKEPFTAHSFVKVEKEVFSTSLFAQQNALPVWSKRC